MKPEIRKCKNPDCNDTFEVTRKGKEYCSTKCNQHHYNNFFRANNKSSKDDTLFSIKLLWGAIYLTVKRKNS